MARYAAEFLKDLVGLRAARSSLTADETDHLRALAKERMRVIEVGVHEGATSRAMAAVLADGGMLMLVDPYVPATRPERMIGRAWTMMIAHRELRAFRNRVKFVRMPSLAAAAQVALDRPADLIFIDADHAYEAERVDVLAWTPHLAADGRIALNDSRICAKRPDLTEDAGPVRYANELVTGSASDWVLDSAVDTLTVVRRRS